jgi:hypothetical protein
MKNIMAGLLVFQVYTYCSKVKRREKMFILFRFEAKQSKKRLFRFAKMKKAEAERSKRKTFWKRNRFDEKQKIRIEKKQTFFSPERAKRISFRFVSL